MVTTTSPRASRKPACSAAALPKFRRRWTTTTFGELVVEPREDGHAAVGRAVVDEDDLEVVAVRLECGGDLARTALERALLVEQGNDDRDHVREGIGLPGRRLQRIDRLADGFRRAAADDAPPTSVVGTYQLACIRIENASACSTGTSRRPSAATPIHWYVPMYPGDDGIATPSASADVTNTASSGSSSIADRARDEGRRRPRRQRPRARRSARATSRRGRRPIGSPSISTVSRRIRRTRPRSRRSRSRAARVQRARRRAPPR